MIFATCGQECSKCEYHELECLGCSACAGKVFWADFRGIGVCPVYACAQQKGYESCALCKEVPCALWDDIRDPDMSEEKYEQVVQGRKQNLAMYLRYVKRDG